MQAFVMQHMYFGCLHDETCCMTRLSCHVCRYVNRHIPKTFVSVDFKQNRFQTANHIVIMLNPLIALVYVNRIFVSYNDHTANEHAVVETDYRNELRPSVRPIFSSPGRSPGRAIVLPQRRRRRLRRR